MKKSVISLAIVLIVLFIASGTVATAATNAEIEEALKLERNFYTKQAISDMRVKRISEDAYRVEYYREDGIRLYAYINQMDWGTWNMGDWCISEGIGKRVVIGGGTDWEYVLRVRNDKTHKVEFAGGNHGNEVLNSFRMYDAVSGKEIELDVDESEYVNRLVLTEQTSLYLENEKNSPFAKVKRKYTFLGRRIHLDCTVEFLKDVRMAMSYTTMACVSKDFGSKCVFDNGTVVKTASEGSFTQKYLGKVPAMCCSFSGDDPLARVKVGIYNKADMTDNFSNEYKTFIWDMTNSYNKLYFSRGSMNEVTPVKKGTVWDFGSYWSISI